MTFTSRRVVAVHFGWLIAFAASAGLLGCYQQVVTVGGDAGSAAAVSGSGGTAGASGASDSEACLAAGGKCVIGPGLGCTTIGPQDCNPTRNPGGAVCCLDGPKVCDQDGGVAMISSKAYDQSCQADSDCVAVAEGDVCFECERYCPGGVVNKNAEAAYRNDVAKLTDPLDPSLVCFCPAEFGPCCINSQCHADEQCLR